MIIFLYAYIIEVNSGNNRIKERYIVKNYHQIQNDTFLYVQIIKG